MPVQRSRSPCYKSSKTAPIGVCSVFSAGKPAIICPIRFLEGYQITKDAADFFFPPRTKYKILPEVRVEIDVGTANRVRVGNIDLVIAAHDDSGRLIDWGALEIQSVYTSGSIGKVFKEHQGQGYPAQFSWPTNETPHPDWLSSTRKRLAPQLLFKGTLLKKWGKKQAVAVQESFYNTLPPLDVPDVAVPRDQADLAWLIYDLDLDTRSDRYRLNHKRTIYTAFEAAMLLITTPPMNSPAGTPRDLQANIQSKLRKALAGKLSLNLDTHTSASGGEEES